MRERMAYLASAPDPGPLLQTLLGLRHDIIMMGGAADVPFSEPLQTRLGPLLARASKATADTWRGSTAAPWSQVRGRFHRRYGNNFR
jgi:hypothetical protein